MAMVIALFLLLVGLLPPLVSVWLSHRVERQLIDRLGLVTEMGYASPLAPRRQRHPDEHYIEGLGWIIGDLTCQLNARSPHIRCAVNPVGPCSGCRFYEGRTYPPIKGVTSD